jgi:hypothetical protein
MAISYEIDTARNLVLTRAAGVLTDADLLEHKRQLIADPAFRPGMREFSDVRAVERLDVTPAGVQDMVALDKEHSAHLGDYRMAIVVSADAVFGTARMYQMMTEQHIESVRIFREPKQAWEWLDADDGVNQ